MSTIRMIENQVQLLCVSQMETHNTHRNASTGVNKLTEQPHFNIAEGDLATNIVSLNSRKWLVAIMARDDGCERFFAQQFPTPRAAKFDAVAVMLDFLRSCLIEWMVLLLHLFLCFHLCCILLVTGLTTIGR